MPTRRTALTGIAAAGLLLATPLMGSPAWAQAGPQAVTFVQSTSSQLAAIVNSDGPPHDKRGRLQGVIDSTVDVDDIARFCLGRFWTTATTDEQLQYTGLFRDLLLTKISAHFGEYRGVRIRMGSARTSGDTEIVATTVERPDAPPLQVDWVVSSNSGTPKVIDLLAGGTSLRMTQSNDFTAYLTHHKYDIHQLIEGMNQLVALGQ